MFLKALFRIPLPWRRAESRTVRSATAELTVWADLARLEQLVADDTDDAELPSLFRLTDPGGRDFGTEVAAFIDHCCEQQILHITAPVTAVGIEATVGGDHRDGGFLVMVTIADRITVASGQLIPEVFRSADDLPQKVLAVVVDIADHTYREFVLTAAAVAGIPS
ncbi:hypothetical protein [Actinoplanes sp. NPDC026619]|uniref:hypothetical protein n=1 Tax=Actinoplanes sp. NPDC026619 TaxID=3155798 RepID=UPI0033C933DD